MKKLKLKVAVIPSISAMIDDCATPIFDATSSYGLLKCSDPNILSLVETHRQLFNTFQARLQLLSILFQQVQQKSM